MTHLHPETLEKLKADAKQPEVFERCERCGRATERMCLEPDTSECPGCGKHLCERCHHDHTHDGGET